LVQTYFGTPLYGLHQFFLVLSKYTNQQLKINVKFPLPVTEIHYSLLTELTLVHFPLSKTPNFLRKKIISGLFPFPTLYHRHQHMPQSFAKKISFKIKGVAFL